jgi:hypothetical protein
MSERVYVDRDGNYTIEGKAVSLGEFDHAQRAEALATAFETVSLDPTTTVHKLAEFLHQQYRAAAKSFHVSDGCPFRHDHGFGECTIKGKKYFRRRAAWLLTLHPSLNGGKVDPR